MLDHVITAWEGEALLASVVEHETHCCPSTESRTIDDTTITIYRRPATATATTTATAPAPAAPPAPAAEA
jgi:hypothetical protein